MLQLKDINLYYGVIHALKNVSLHIKQGEIVTLIGSNGAGKSSTLRAISGVERIKDGSIQFNGVNISKLNPSQIVSMGLSHVPEGRRVFPKMSIMENLEMGAYTRKDKAEVKRDYEKVFDIFPRLKERRSQMAGTLSGGEQQMLAIGRALMSKPKLLLLDEPSMGLAPLVVKEIFSIIQKISSEGTTVLLVEQNASMALKIADRAYIIANGVIEIEGKARELLHDDKVKKAYLGG
ncbi:MAG: ABC transporter ATP-binding protein [Clostridia bacterium]|jgi:branched-chain amino acid transport system ATP-binding protein|nr:ABC transporter ATP-binding protein [Clostridia bacterium]